MNRKERQLRARESAYQRHARYLRLHPPPMPWMGGEQLWNYSFGYDIPHEGRSRSEIDRVRISSVRRRTRATSARRSR
jgi:hypothetical protein